MPASHIGNIKFRLEQFFICNPNTHAVKAHRLFGCSLSYAVAVRIKLCKKGLVPKLKPKKSGYVWTQKQRNAQSKRMIGNMIWINSTGMRGKKHCKHTRIKMSESADKIRSKKSRWMKRAWKKGVFLHSGVGKGKVGTRKDLGHFVRSTWEANYARYLKINSIKYEYEPKRFYLKELNCSYAPDFRLEDDTYVEVKGQDNYVSRLKRKAFRKQYGKRLVVIGKKRYNRLCKLYKSAISNWE